MASMCVNSALCAGTIKIPASARAQQRLAALPKPLGLTAQRTQCFQPLRKQSRRSLQGVVRAEAGSSSGPYVEDTSFSISKVSFGSILSPIGVSLMIYGFGAFFQLLPGADLSSVILVYGFPISLLGFALSYAQLDPVPCRSTAEALALRETQCTDIQKQLREDVTRYRYGDEQHLDEALSRIFKFNTPNGISRRLTPKLTGLREEARSGKYTLVLEFETNPNMTMEMWETRLERIQNFFGPGIEASLAKTDQGVDVALTSDGSGKGMGGTGTQDVMPPLMPGLPPRVVNRE